MSATEHAKILIADDDPVMRLAMRDMLACEPNWEVIEAENGAKAWQHLQSGTPVDVCIADIRMPELDGLGLLRNIRSSRSHRRIAVILCTSVHDRPTVQQAATLSVDAYILKPFRPDLLLSRVRRFLAEKERQPTPGAPRPSEWNLTEFVQRAGKPPALITIYQELAAALKRPDTPISEFSRIILQDQAFTARLLQLANGCFYAGHANVSTVQTAAQLVGLEQIEHLVLATSIIEIFEHLPEQVASAAGFWEHSVACAMASALLAERLNHPAPERLFIGGLLHEIGRLMVYLHAPAESLKVLRQCQEQAQLSCKVEREVLGFDHAMLGGELVTFWRLPKSLSELVERHHPSPKSPVMPTDAGLIHYADFITSALGFGQSGEPCLSPLMLPPSLLHLLADATQTEMLLDELESRCRELLPLLRKNTTTPQDGTGAAPASCAGSADTAEALADLRFRHVDVSNPAVASIRRRAMARAVANSTS